MRWALRIGDGASGVAASARALGFCGVAACFWACGCGEAAAAGIDSGVGSCASHLYACSRKVKLDSQVRMCLVKSVKV